MHDEFAQSSCGRNSPFFLHSSAPFAHLSILHTYLCPFVVLDPMLKALNTKKLTEHYHCLRKNYRNQSSLNTTCIRWVCCCCPQSLCNRRFKRVCDIGKWTVQLHGTAEIRQGHKNQSCMWYTSHYIRKHQDVYTYLGITVWDEQSSRSRLLPRRPPLSIDDARRAPRSTHVQCAPGSGSSPLPPGLGAAVADRRGQSRRALRHASLSRRERGSPPTRGRQRTRSGGAVSPTGTASGGARKKF